MTLKQACGRRTVTQAPRLRRAAALACVALAAATAALAADPPLKPVRVCEALEDPTSYTGKPVALVGRFSFRETGRFLSEETCGRELKNGGVTWPATLRLAEDPKSAPKPPGVLEIDAAALDEKLKLIRRHTRLRNYPFGTPDYDRWAIVYGRFELSKDFINPPASGNGNGNGKKSGAEPLPAELYYRGSGVILFVDDR